MTLMNKTSQNNGSRKSKAITMMKAMIIINPKDKMKMRKMKMKKTNDLKYFSYLILLIKL